jgi:hypothetical protein
MFTILDHAMNASPDTATRAVSHGLCVGDVAALYCEPISIATTMRQTKQKADMIDSFYRSPLAACEWLLGLYHHAP